ncbi:MAG: FprA family A-type flavoprotein [Cyanobacteria bacterium SIG28]|nr:FprA family A-type flavoprotein [Cyanobacteria bacterium SIG28]
MQNIRKVTDNIFYIGCSSRKQQIFEAIYPIDKGISYNSYFIDDEKTVLIDTVDKSCAEQFYENLDKVLSGRKLDYMIIQHMEPDHAALINNIATKYPEVKIVCTSKTVNMIKQFFDLDISTSAMIVKEGDSLNSGKHEFHFVMAPMVHWPEVMVTYEKNNGILFSADAFGSFGAINGNLYDSQINFERDYLDEARRYYTNIVGQYGMQVQALLKKASTIDIKMICPLHGVIVKENIGLFVEKYNKWSLYEPENKSIMIAYSSVYGGTENAVNILAGQLADKGVNDIKIFDTSITHPSHILAEAFKASHIVIATTTYNAGIFETMDRVLNSFKKHNLQNRKYVIIQNGSWAPTCTKQVRELIESIKGSEIIDDSICITSSLKEEQITEIERVADLLVNSLK